MRKLDAIANKTKKALRCKIVQCGGRCLRPGETCRLSTTPRQKNIFKDSIRRIRLSSTDKALIAGATGLVVGAGLAAIASRSGGANTPKETLLGSNEVTASTQEQMAVGFSPVNSNVKVNQPELDKQRATLVKKYGKTTVEAAEINTQKILRDPSNDAYTRVPSIDRLEGIIAEGFLSGAQLASKGINRFNQSARDKVEEKVLGVTSANTPDEERPIYAYLGESDKEKGLAHKYLDDSIYGTINIKLKPGVKNRSTFTGSDSFSSGIASPVVTSDGSTPNAASLARLTFRGQDDNPRTLKGYAKKAYIPDPSDNKTRLQQAAKAKTPGELAQALNGRSEKDPPYVELQIQGGVKPTDISEIYFNPKYDPSDPSSFDDRPTAKVAQWAKDNGVGLFVNGKKINPDDLIPPPPPPSPPVTRKQAKQNPTSVTGKTARNTSRSSKSKVSVSGKDEVSRSTTSSSTAPDQPDVDPFPAKETISMKAELIPQGITTIEERANRRAQGLLPSAAAQKLLLPAAITASAISTAKSGILPGISIESQKLLPASVSQANVEKQAEVEVKKIREQTKKLISESRDLRLKRGRMETELQKAVDKIELGQRLQKKESDIDKLRGVDYEMIALERKAKLETKIAEIQSREEQIRALLSPKSKTQSLDLTNANPSIGKPVTLAKGLAVIEEREARKQKPRTSPEQIKSSVTQDEKVVTKRKERSILQRITSRLSRKQNNEQATEDKPKESPKDRRRRERAENKKLKQELIEQTGRSASKAMARNAYKTPLNLVVPGLGDAVEKADKFFGDKTRLEKWANDLEQSGDINVSRREFFRGGGRFVAKQTVAKPKGITQELRRGAEISKDFFDQLVGGNSDEIILKGSKSRGFGASRGTKIQLTKNEFDRIVRTYNSQQKRQLLNFLEFIGFPIP